MADAPFPGIAHFSDPPSIGLEPYINDDEIITDALVRLERYASRMVGTWGIPDREVYGRRLDQVRDLIRRRQS